VAEVHLAAALEQQPDLQKNLSAFKANRAVVIEFIRSEYFEEAQYDDRGLPIAGKVGDFYKVPGSDTKALTKRGSSKVKQLFRWHRGAAHKVDGEQTKEYCSATIEVQILDQFGRVVGSGIGSCNSAEMRFTSVGSVKKYGGLAEFEKGKGAVVKRAPDYRAALHDITSVATKRADTQATIVAAALEEIFTMATEDETREEKPEEREPAAYPGRPVALLPKGKFGQYGGQSIAKVPTPDLVKIRDFMRGGTKDAPGAKNPKAWEPLADAIDTELDARRQEPPAGEDDLPL
jgi:hypothetical protein